MTMISQQNIVHTRDYVAIEFDVTSEEITDKLVQCRNNVNKTQFELSLLLSINKNLIEMIRPKPIKGGLRIQFNIYINNTKSIDMNLERKMNEAQNNGELSELIKKGWDLKEGPFIGNIHYEQKQSKHRQDHMVVINFIKNISKRGSKMNLGIQPGANDRMYGHHKLSVIAEDENDNPLLPNSPKEHSKFPNGTYCYIEDSKNMCGVIEDCLPNGQFRITDLFENRSRLINESRLTKMKDNADIGKARKLYIEYCDNNNIDPLLSALKDDWECKACTMLNEQQLDRCEVCDAERENVPKPEPDEEEEGSSSSTTIEKGEWQCSECHIVNDAKLKFCGVCNAARYEKIDNVIAKKSSS